MSCEKTEFIEDELVYLWDSLWRAERRSLSYDPRIPSMEMEGIMNRIADATCIVGPVDWDEISTEALQSGRYEHWANYMGIDHQTPTEEEIAELTKKRKRRVYREDH